MNQLIDEVKPLVSIIINCYNGEKYLKKAIESVLAQSYKNWEIIFWDNQSTDASAQIFTSYADTRLNYFIAPSHTLLYEARNYALEKTNGEFIAFLDIDDWWEVDKLEQQILLFKDAKVGLVYGNYWTVDRRNGNSQSIAYSKNLPEGMVLNQLLNEYLVGMLTIVVRRKALDNLDKVFDARFQIIGDFDMSIRLAVHWKFACVQKPVASYLFHDNNLSLLESDRWFGELEIWFTEMKKYPIINSQNGFEIMCAKVTYAKIMSILMQGKRITAFILFWHYPKHFIILKFKLLIAILLPLKIIRLLKT